MRQRSIPNCIKIQAGILKLSSGNHLTAQVADLDQSESSSLIKYARILTCNNPRLDIYEKKEHTKLHQNPGRDSKVIVRNQSVTDGWTDGTQYHSSRTTLWRELKLQKFFKKLEKFTRHLKK